MKQYDNCFPEFHKFCIECCTFAVVFMELLKIMWMLTDHVFIKNIKKALEEPGQLVAPLDVPLAPITGLQNNSRK